MSGVRILSRTSSKTKTGQDVLSFVLFESGSDSNEFEISAPLRSAQNRRHPDVLGLLTYNATLVVFERVEFYVSLRSAQNRGLRFTSVRAEPRSTGPCAPPGRLGPSHVQCNFGRLRTSSKSPFQSVCYKSMRSFTKG